MSKQPPKLFPRSNGSLVFATSLPFAYHTFEIVGGPYDNYVAGPNTFGVCVRQERHRPNDVHVPIVDFSIPKDDKATASAVIETIKAAIDGKDVYVGCMGGWGRTGLFLGLIVKVMRPDVEPVQYVKKHYTSHAIETEEQKRFIRDFDVGAIKRAVMFHAWKRRLQFWR